MAKLSLRTLRDTPRDDFAVFLDFKAKGGKSAYQDFVDFALKKTVG